MKKSKNNEKLISFVSPAHVINTVIIFALCLFSLIGILIFCTWCFFGINLDKKDFNIAFISLITAWLVYSIVIFIVAFSTRKGLAVVRIYKDTVETKILNKSMCKLKWEDIEYIYFVKSYNYGADVSPVYAVLSKEKIEKKENLALTYDVKNHIVVRITRKNQKIVMNKFFEAGFIGISSGDFDSLDRRVRQETILCLREKITK